MPISIVCRIIYYSQICPLGQELYLLFNMTTAKPVQVNPSGPWCLRGFPHQSRVFGQSRVIPPTASRGQTDPRHKVQVRFAFVPNPSNLSHPSLPTVASGAVTSLSPRAALGRAPHAPRCRRGQRDSALVLGELPTCKETDQAPLPVHPTPASASLRPQRVFPEGTRPEPPGTKKQTAANRREGKTRRRNGQNDGARRGLGCPTHAGPVTGRRGGCPGARMPGLLAREQGKGPRELKGAGGGKPV